MILGYKTQSKKIRTSLNKIKELEKDLEDSKNGFIQTFFEDLRKEYNENKVVKYLLEDYTELSELYYLEKRTKDTYEVNTHNVEEHEFKDKLIILNLKTQSLVEEFFYPFLKEKDYIEISVYKGKLNIDFYIELFGDSNY